MFAISIADNVIIIFSISYFFIPCLSFRNILGPADMLFTSFTHCEPQLKELDAWIAQRKYNRTHNVLDISLTSPWTIDDDLILELMAEIKKDGGYKPGSYHMKNTICKVLSTLLGDVFAAFLNVAGTEDCPIPSGTYEIKDFYVDNDKMTVPQLYGEYRARAEVFREKETEKVACYYIYLNVVPKEQ